MPEIKPFSAIRPNPLLELSLAETGPQTQSVVIDGFDDGGPLSLKTHLELVARQRPETETGQSEAFRLVNDNFRSLLKHGILVPDPEPAIYVYEAGGQTGVWCLTRLDGRIKLHEQTLPDSVRRLSNYRRATGLEGSPILLTYAPDAGINTLIAAAKQTPPRDLGGHLIWKVADPLPFIQAFARFGEIYLADGHHRLASAAGGLISSLYMASDQIRISPFHRATTAAVSPEALKSHFIVAGALRNQPVRPARAGHLGLRHNGHWYDLVNSAKDRSDAEALHAALPDAPFGYLGAHEPLPEGTIFTLAPLPIRDLFRAADAGRILPPKTTWIDPKIPYGLLIHHHEKP